MPFRAARTITTICLTLLATRATTVAQPSAPPVSEPPAAFFEKVREEHRDAARAFYAKSIDIEGIPVAASAEVADEALSRTHEIVSRMLAGRTDVREEMIRRDMYLVIIGKNQFYTDMPEYRNRPNKEYLNERVRGTGGNPTSFGEENLLSVPIDRYDDESIAVHEFCHTIDSALRSLEPTWRERKRAVYQNAIEKGLYKGAYAAGNSGEYWAEICQSYFDCNRVNNWNHGPIGTREQLKVHDPEGYELVRSSFNLNGEQDWRYRWLQPLPNVAPPPAKLGVDPYYTKFTWAREFTVVGRGADDEALLAANDTIRKLFAYRHDVLKALIADGVRLVVLGAEESAADLPEYRALDRAAFDPTARVVEYTPRTKVLVVGEEYVIGSSGDRRVAQNLVIRLFAGALYHVTGTRPVDPDWESRPNRLRQQYELGVTRLDERFDAELGALYTAATEAGRWKGTPAVHGRAAYWAEGVLAYFDALGEAAPPNDSPHPISTRDALKDYDPALHALVSETMAYEGRVDWRAGR